MNIKHTASAKVLFGCFNFIFFVFGFLEVVCGFLLLCDSQRILLSRLLASPESELTDPPFYYLALALLILGLTVCTIASLGVWATYMPGYVVLTIYFLSVLGLLLCECAGGVVAATWPRCAGLQSARGGATAALQAYYAVPEYEDFTAAVDLAQTKLECCGMTSARNYDMSIWQLRRLGPRGMSVPLSCCVQLPDASYLSPAPLNQSRCQEIQLDPKSRHASRKIKELAIVQLECCGMTSARNYDMSIWQLRRLGPRGMSVPLSCCVQLPDASYLSPAPLNQSRCQEIQLDPKSRHASRKIKELAIVQLECCGMTSARNYDMSIWQLSCCVQLPDASYLSPAPLNQSLCQEIQLDPKSRHASGCLSRLEDWYQQQYMVFMLALFVVAVFKLAILFSTVFSCIQIKRRRQNIHTLMMKSADLKANENIYESRMSGVHDEPITARYVQPNNFYSPRVRNPTIFHGKPNEMI